MKGTEFNPIWILCGLILLLDLRNSRLAAPARTPSQFSTFIVIPQQVSVFDSDPTRSVRENSVEPLTSLDFSTYLSDFVADHLHRSAVSTIPAFRFEFLEMADDHGHLQRPGKKGTSADRAGNAAGKL
jgi:hypothetical protein